MMSGLCTGSQAACIRLLAGITWLIHRSWVYSIIMNSIIQSSAFFLLCFVNWVQGKRFNIELRHEKVAVLFYLPAQCEDDSVRLTGGPNEFEGRVEICVGGNWGQVCAMQWTSGDAEVVCRQLGHSTDRCELLTDLSHMCLIYSCTNYNTQLKQFWMMFMMVMLHQLVFMMFNAIERKIDWWTVHISPLKVLQTVLPLWGLLELFVAVRQW